jgi:large subunit ribosomal protein L4
MYGGARVFGPKPRDYSFKLNKKLRQLARRSALSYKIQGNQLLVVEDFSFDSPKTKDFAALIQNFQLDGRRILLVTGEIQPNLVLSGRNIPNARVMLAQDLNTYEVMNAHCLLVQQSAVAKIQETLS